MIHSVWNLCRACPGKADEKGNCARSMDFLKDCRVMVERLSCEDLQFHKVSAQNSEMSLVNLQRVAIKEEMKTEEDCNYDHLSKDDLINEVKVRDIRVRDLEAQRNVLISNMAKERVKTSLTINKQVDEIERLNRVNKELERRIKDLMEEKSGMDQLANDELVKSEPVENDSGINGQELSLPIVTLRSVEDVNVQDISQESPVSEPQYVAKKTDRENPSMPKLKRVDPRPLRGPVSLPKPEHNPNELSELASVSMEVNSPEVPIEVGNNSSVSNSETFQEIAPKNSESRSSEIGKKRSTWIKHSAEYKRGSQRRIKKGNEEKRFKCDQCDYASTCKSDLIKHQRIHSGEKPFQCDQCDYASTRKSDLIVHKRIHNDEKPFKCNQCDFASTWKSSLREHKRRSHMNN